MSSAAPTAPSLFEPSVQLGTNFLFYLKLFSRFHIDTSLTVADKCVPHSQRGVSAKQHDSHHTFQNFNSKILPGIVWNAWSTSRTLGKSEV